MENNAAINTNYNDKPDSFNSFFQLADSKFVKGDEVNPLALMQRTQELQLEFTIEELLTYIRQRESRMRVCSEIIYET
jgi:hypothetical protein